MKRRSFLQILGVAPAVPLANQVASVSPPPVAGLPVEEMMRRHAEYLRQKQLAGEPVFVGTAACAPENLMRTRRESQ